MQTRGFITSLAVLCCSSAMVLAQAATPTPVDSNVAVTSFAQSRGNPCSGGQGSTGCGGCYPITVDASSDPTAMLGLVNPEWQPIGPMIPGVDASLPPDSVPVTINGTVMRSKINVGGDFFASHQGDDQNTLITPDPNLNSLLATGNLAGCPGPERCGTVEMEWEIAKYPLFAWAGEGDRITAVGRWVFDCGHQFSDPVSRCSNGGAFCTSAADCPGGTCDVVPLPVGKCSNGGADCTIDSDCGGGTCDSPPPDFGYRAELHPPHAVAVIRNKSIGRRPATRADVYISADGGGAGDVCTVTHLTNPLDVLLSKACFVNRCSPTGKVADITDRSCRTDKDCPKKETCILLDPDQRIADVNASDFEFDMPLPPQPQGATKLKIKAKKIRIKGVKGSQMPKPTFGVTPGPTPNLHVIVPMTVPVKGQLPSVFAESISAAWKGDKTKLKKVQVKLTGITINNPLKRGTPSIPHVCTNPTDPANPLSTTACTSNDDCPTGTCMDNGKACHVDQDCKTSVCVDGSRCLGGTVPGWLEFVQVNGDWVELAGLDALGTEAPFAAPPYTQPTTPLTIKQKARFNEFVSGDDGSVHIATTGHSLSCFDPIYGFNLSEDLATLGFTVGADCLANGGNLNPGRVDVTFNAPDFTTPTGSPTTCTPTGKFTTCSSTSVGGDAGTCSSTTSQLCVLDTDCPMGETCNVTGGAFTLEYRIKVK